MNNTRKKQEQIRDSATSLIACIDRLAAEIGHFYADMTPAAQVAARKFGRELICVKRKIQGVLIT